MSDESEEMLQRVRDAIERLVPLTPKSVIEEANQIIRDLEGADVVTPEQVRQALVYIGRKEFPYRKAYLALCAGDEEQRLQEHVLMKLPDDVKDRCDSVIKYGVHILDFVRSSQFDALEDDVKVAIDNAIREAHDDVNRQCDERAHHRSETYQQLVDEWTETVERMQKLLEILKDMADRDAQYHDDILNQVKAFENGFSLLEDDPTEEEIEKAITYWSDVLGEESEEEIDEIE
jgi:hypothetical protein